MRYQFPPNVQRLIDAPMGSGRYASADDLLRDALEPLEAEQDDLRAIQEGLDSVERGEEGRPAG